MDNKDLGQSEKAFCFLMRSVPATYLLGTLSGNTLPIALFYETDPDEIGSEKLLMNQFESPTSVDFTNVKCMMQGKLAEKAYHALLQLDSYGLVDHLVTLEGTWFALKGELTNVNVCVVADQINFEFNVMVNMQIRNRLDCMVNGIWKARKEIPSLKGLVAETI